MATRVTSLRIDLELLEEIRRRARTEGRSVSAQILHLVRRELGVSSPPPRTRTRRTMGWLAHLDVPEDLETFRRFRRSLSRRILKGLRRKAGSR
jgi:hypothetical protein